MGIDSGHENDTIELVLATPFLRIHKRTRIRKLMTLTEQRGWFVNLLCWDRQGDFSVADKFLNLRHEKILQRGGVSPGWWLKIHYVVWMVRLTIHLLRCPPEHPVYCLGFECAFPAYVASRFRSIAYLYDDADRFSLIANLPKPFNGMLQRAEQATSANSIAHIVPGLARYEFRNDQQVVLRNTPGRQALQASEQFQPVRPNAQVVIYVNGWMGEVRGLPIINALAERMHRDGVPIHFVAAGRIDSAAGHEFVSRKNVTYSGEISNAEALAWYRVVDLVYTYYDPLVPINRFAESNKWGDAIHFGVPPIVNSEVRTANFLRERSACLTVPYRDIDELQAALLDLLAHPEKLTALSANIASLRRHMVYFDEGLNTILDRAYGQCINESLP